MAEGGGLLNRCTGESPYRGFESHPLRHLHHVWKFNKTNWSGGESFETPANAFHERALRYGGYILFH